VSPRRPSTWISAADIWRNINTTLIPTDNNKPSSTPSTSTAATAHTTSKRSRRHRK